MIRILLLEHVACILYQSMLKATSASEKGSASLAGELNPTQGSFHAEVRATRGRPKRVEGIEELRRSARTQFAGRKP